MKSRKKKLGKEFFMKLIEANFFDEWKTMKSVLEEMESSGFTIKGKKIGNVSQTLTRLCQDLILRRRKVPKEMQKESRGKWEYKRRV